VDGSPPVNSHAPGFEIGLVEDRGVSTHLKEQHIEVELAGVGRHALDVFGGLARPSRDPHRARFVPFARECGWAEQQAPPRSDRAIHQPFHFRMSVSSWFLRRIGQNKDFQRAI
jgi:hypothetical protein